MSSDDDLNKILQRVGSDTEVVNSVISRTELSPAEIIFSAAFSSMERFEETGSLQELELVIALMEQATDLRYNYHNTQFLCLSLLVVALNRRHEHTGSMDDLDRAISTGE